MAINDGRVISNFIIQALRGENITVFGDGRQTRSFCYVSDLIEGLVGLQENTRDHFRQQLRKPRRMDYFGTGVKVLFVMNNKTTFVFKTCPWDDPPEGFQTLLRP
jgi:UDP-glucuronate decarboxylase